MNVTLWASIIAIFLAIFLGWRTKINIGYFGIVFAYLIGTFLLGMRPKAVYALFNTNLFFTLFCVTFFYNFAMENKTLEKVALNILHGFKSHANLLPFVMYFVAALCSLMGAGFFAVMVMLTPLTILMCQKTKMDPLLGCISVFFGGIAGGNMFTCSTGAVIRGLIENAGYAEKATDYTVASFFAILVFGLAAITLYYFLLKGYKVKGASLDFEKPEPYTKEQKTTLSMIVVLFALMLVPYVLSYIIKDSAALKTIQKSLDVAGVSMILAIGCILKKLANEQDAFKKVPWKTIIMLCGVGMLISVASEAGITDALANAVSGTNRVVVPILSALCAAIMSLFSSTTGVVLPTMFPVVPVLAEASGVAPLVFFIFITAASGCAGIFPFSSGGGLILASTADEELKQNLYPRLMKCAVINIVLAMVVVAVVSIIV